MTILVTAASGHLGSLVVDALLTRGADPNALVATARDESRIRALQDRGVTTAKLDYDQPETIDAALAGVDRVLLISGSVPGARVTGHQHVIEAAERAGVQRLVYTSAPKATTAEFVLAPDHKATEELLASSRVPTVVLRNNWYTENYADDLNSAKNTGLIAHSAGDGKVASAPRRDYAEAAAAVLLAPDGEHEGHVYELGSDRPWNFDELASVIGELTGREVIYQRLTTDEHVARLTAAGLDEGTAQFVAAVDDGIRRGVLADSDGTLARLIGRPTTGLAEALRPLLTS